MHRNSLRSLASLGGEAVRSTPWPQWPRADRSTEEALLKVLRSERWTISGPCTVDPPFERRFAEAFADFHNARHCVPTANGSAALTIALEVLGVGPGKEVLVPGLTWVACASAVARVGGVPILVDVDPKTLCMSESAARSAITPATAAIILVHLYCTAADLHAFTALSATAGLPLIEDCSHAHGASLQGRRVGSFGALGVFSMQQTKVLTSGEGGAVITDDIELYDHLQQLRADGRRYVQRPEPGAPELENVGAVQGYNYCLSEFHSAILLDRLHHLPHENQIRETNARALTDRLRQLEQVQPLYDPKADYRPAFYRYCLRLDLKPLGDIPIETVASALTAELGLPVQPIYDPLNSNIIFDPRKSPRTKRAAEPDWVYDPSRFLLPVARAQRRQCLVIPHNALLGGLQEIDDIIAALVKVLSRADQLAELSARQGGVS